MLRTAISTANLQFTTFPTTVAASYGIATLTSPVWSRTVRTRVMETGITSFTTTNLFKISPWVRRCPSIGGLISEGGQGSSPTTSCPICPPRIGETSSPSTCRSRIPAGMQGIFLAGEQARQASNGLVRLASDKAMTPRALLLIHSTFGAILLNLPEWGYKSMCPMNAARTQIRHQITFKRAVIISLRLSRVTQNTPIRIRYVAEPHQERRRVCT